MGSDLFGSNGISSSEARNIRAIVKHAVEELFVVDKDDVAALQKLLKKWPESKEQASKADISTLEEGKHHLERIRNEIANNGQIDFNGQIDDVARLANASGTEELYYSGDDLPKDFATCVEQCYMLDQLLEAIELHQEQNHGASSELPTTKNVEHDSKKPNKSLPRVLTVTTLH